MLRIVTVAALGVFAVVVSAAEPVTSRGGMVVSVSPPATDVGVAVLKAGGNAVDSAIAVAFAEAVTWPEAGNIGGGGFMLIWPGKGEAPVFIDYREMAPAAANKDLFARGVNYQSILTAGVPGTVRGLELAHKKFGKRPWKELLAPAIQLAGEGFPVTDGLARRLNSILAEKKTTNAEFRRTFGNKSGTWKAGDILKQPDLAKTLRAIATEGADAFYTGPLAELLVAEMKAENGLVTAEDLKKYTAKERKPIRGTYRGYEVFAPSPPSSGGIALVEMLNMLEPFEVKKHPWESAETAHLMSEVMRRAFADRAVHLGDADFVKVPDHLISKEHARKAMTSFDPNKATRSETLAPEIEVHDGTNTTHFSIVDANGMAVSNTYTLENSFGCRIVVRGAGYILNNEMTDFNPRPGVTTRTGMIGTTPNQIAPGKRMLSSMTPTMVAKDGKLLLVTGSPGGRTIINTVLSVVVNVVDYGTEIQAAVDAPRLHHQWFPDRISAENRPGFAEFEKVLQAKGHKVLKHAQGDAHSIWIDPKTGLRHAGVDHRLDGKGAGTE